MLVVLAAVALLATVIVPLGARNAAATGTTWVKSYYGGAGRSVQPTTDGGYVVLGTTASWWAEEEDAWVLKLSAAGAVEWQQAYGGVRDDWSRVILQTSDGAYVVAADTASFGPGTPSTGQPSNAWILKLDALGGVQWQKAYGGAGMDLVNDIQQTSDGGYVVAGRTNSHRPGVEYLESFDAWVMKLDSAGSVVWQNAYGETKYGECASSIEQTSDGGYVLAGSAWGSITLWAFGLTSDGRVSWSKAYYPGAGGDVLCGNANDWASAHFPNVLKTPDGGYLLVAVTQNYGQGNRDGWLVKVDSAGRIQWQKAYGTAGLDEFFSTDVTSDGGYVLAGVTPSGAWVVRVDSPGTVVWQKTYAMSTGESRAEGQRIVRQTSDGGFVLAGNWAEGLFVMKLDGNGNAGTCIDPGIGADSSAVVTGSTSRPSGKNAKASAPSTTSADTSAIPSATSAAESQRCLS